jgi:hypothetical protein
MTTMWKRNMQKPPLTRKDAAPSFDVFSALSNESNEGSMGLGLVGGDLGRREPISEPATPCVIGER